MGVVKNAVNEAKKYKGKVNPLYELTIQNAFDIQQSSDDPWEIIRCSFLFGYAQGIKSAKAEADCCRGAKKHA